MCLAGTLSCCAVPPLLWLLRYLVLFDATIRKESSHPIHDLNNDDIDVRYDVLAPSVYLSTITTGTSAVILLRVTCKRV